MNVRIDTTKEEDNHNTISPAGEKKIINGDCNGKNGKSRSKLLERDVESSSNHLDDTYVMDSFSGGKTNNPRKSGNRNHSIFDDSSDDDDDKNDIEKCDSVERKRSFLGPFQRREQTAEKKKKKDKKDDVFDYLMTSIVGLTTFMAPFKATGSGGGDDSADNDNHDVIRYDTFKHFISDRNKEERKKEMEQLNAPSSATLASKKTEEKKQLLKKMESMALGTSSQAEYDEEMWSQSGVSSYSNNSSFGSQMSQVSQYSQKRSRFRRPRKKDHQLSPMDISESSNVSNLSMSSFGSQISSPKRRGGRRGGKRKKKKSFDFSHQKHLLGISCQGISSQGISSRRIPSFEVKRPSPHLRGHASPRGGKMKKKQLLDAASECSALTDSSFESGVPSSKRRSSGRSRRRRRRPSISRSKSMNDDILSSSRPHVSENLDNLYGKLPF